MILMLMTSSFLGFLTTIYLTLSLQPIRIELSFLFLFIFIGSLVMTFVKIPSCKPNNFITRHLKNFQNGFSMLQKNKRTIKNLVVLKFVILFISTLQTKIIFDSINYPIDLEVVILIVMSISSLTMITILPGNIGFAESLSGIITTISGSTFAYGFIGVTTGRIIQMVWIFVLGGFFLFYFAYRLGCKSGE
nr:hypothetical protein [Desulfobacula sp.]